MFISGNINIIHICVMVRAIHMHFFLKKDWYFYSSRKYAIKVYAYVVRMIFTTLCILICEVWVFLRFIHQKLGMSIYVLHDTFTIYQCLFINALFKGKLNKVDINKKRKKNLSVRMVKKKEIKKKYFLFVGTFVHF